MFLFYQDERVANWMFTISQCSPVLKYNMAIGLVENEAIVGAILYTNYNGSDAEVHYYGPKKLSVEVVRLIFRIAIKVFNLSRLTIRTRKEHMSRGVLKLGAVYEGTIKRLYGPTDEDIHAGKQYVFFRETIERLAAFDRSV